MSRPKFISDLEDANNHRHVVHRRLIVDLLKFHRYFLMETHVGHDPHNFRLRRSMDIQQDEAWELVLVEVSAEELAVE